MEILQKIPGKKSLSYCKEFMNCEQLITLLISRSKSVQQMSEQSDLILVRNQAPDSQTLAQRRTVIPSLMQRHFEMLLRLNNREQL